MVSGSFNLAGRPVPLPEGEFVLAASAITDARIVQGDISRPRSRIVNVFLAQVEAGKLRNAVWAATVLESRAGPFNWVQEPCRKDDTLFRLNLADDTSHGEYAHHNCLIVEHWVRRLAPNAPGILKEASAWLAQGNVEVPVPLLIAATVTRTERREFIRATYLFNPQAFGCSAPRSRSSADSPWHRNFIERDPQRVRFVESVTAWGKFVQYQFDKLITRRGRLAAAETAASTIYQCADRPL